MSDYQLKYTGEQIDIALDNMANLQANEVREFLGRNLIAGLASPKGVYATFADLQAEHPTGNTSIYVVAADGKWYYWDVSVWKAGGVYQSTEIDDKSVTLSKLDLGRAGNLFANASQLEIGYYYTNTGTKTADATMCNIKIPMSPGDILCIFADWSGISSPGIYVKATGDFIGSVANGKRSQLMRSDYMLIQAPDDTQLAYVYLNNTVARVRPETFHAIKQLDRTVPLSNANINSGFLSSDVFASGHSSVVENLVLPDYVMRNLHMNASGTYVIISDVCALPPVPVGEGDIVSVENGATAPGVMSTFGVWLNSEKKAITGFVSGGSVSATHAAPAGAAYFFPTLMISSVDAGACRIYRVKAQPEIRVNRFALYPPERDGALVGKKWVSLGDSITAREMWQPLVAGELGLIHVNCGIGSTALAGTGGTAFWQQTRLDAVIAAAPDIVTILGGANDLTDINITIGTETEFALALSDKNKMTFLGAYSYIIERLLTWKPTLRIIILGTTWAHGDGVLVRPSGSTLTYTNFSDACRLVAAYYGLPFVDLHGEAGFNRFTVGAHPYNIYSADEIHPNAAGGKRMADLVLSTMERVIRL
jgi:lysophospholipase L1-like esterase